MTHILNLTTSELAQWLETHAQPAFSAETNLGWIFERRADSFEDRAICRSRSAKNWPAVFNCGRRRSATHKQAEDGTEKLLVQLADGGRVRVCLGCAMVCVDRFV